MNPNCTVGEGSGSLFWHPVLLTLGDSSTQRFNAAPQHCRREKFWSFGSVTGLNMGTISELPRSQILNSADLESVNKIVRQPWHLIFHSWSSESGSSRWLKATPKCRILLETHERRRCYLMLMQMLCRLRLGKSWFLIPVLLPAGFCSLC